MKIRGARVVILLLSILTIFIGCDMESVKEKPLEENKSAEERVALDESAEVEDSVMVEDSQTEEKIVRVEEKANNEEDIVNTDTKRNVVESEEIINDYDNFTYIDYYNQRFGYAIKYPSFLTNKFGASNNDGITAENNDKTVSFIVYGSNNALNQDSEDAFNFSNSVRPFNNMTYKSISDEFYIVSGEEDGSIYYEYSIVGTGSINTFRIEYPKSDKEYFDPIVAEIYQSFIPGDLSKGW